MNLSGQEVPPEDLPDNLSGQEVPPEDLPEPISGSEVPPHDLPDEAKQEQYGTPLQKLTSVVEGFTGPVGTVIETADVPQPGSPVVSMLAKNPIGALALAAKAVIGKVNPEEIQARKEVNPAEHLAGEVGSFFATPELGVAFKGLEKAGSHALNSAIIGGGAEAGNEYQKALLGQGDPIPAVAAKVAGATLASAIGGYGLSQLGRAGSYALKQLENNRMGTALKSWLAGIGHAASFPEESVAQVGEHAVDKGIRLSDQFVKTGTRGAFDPKWFEKGQEHGYKIPNILLKSVALPAAGSIAYKSGLSSGEGPVFVVAEQAIEKLLKKPISSATKSYLGPAVMKAAASGHTDHLYDVINHATSIAKGASLIGKGIESCFQAGEQPIIDDNISDRESNIIKDHIENGLNVTDNPGYADGGVVQDTSNPVANVYPEQNVLLSATRARVHNYLNSLRPVKVTGLPFDIQHKDPHKDSEYNQAIKLANKPLAILNKVRNGTLLPKHVAALNSMYPELHQHLSSKFAEKIADMKMKDEKIPPYKVRQALSLFMGTNLDSSITPQSIQAAQSVFIRQKAQKAIANKESALNKMDDSARTPNQAREQRLNKN